MITGLSTLRVRTMFRNAKKMLRLDQIRTANAAAIRVKMILGSVTPENVRLLIDSGEISVPEKIDSARFVAMVVQANNAAESENDRMVSC